MNDMIRDRPIRSLDGPIPGLDIAKFACAAIVVAIHTKPLSWMGPGLAQGVVEAVECVAVPFFFVTSSFLCFRGVDLSEFAGPSGRGSAGARRARATIRKLLRLYVVWSLVYLPVTILGFVLSGTRWQVALLAFARGFLLVGENFCSWPLWYLLASVTAFSIVYSMLRGGASWRAILAIGIVASAMGYAMQGLRGCGGLLGQALDLYFLAFINVRNGLFVGLPYVSVGLAIAAKRRAIAEMHPVWGLTLAVAGFAGCLFVSPDVHLPFCATFSVGVFVLATGREGAAHPFLRASSTVVYLTHMLVAVVAVFGVAGGREASLLDNGVSGPLLFVIAWGGSLVISALVCRISSKNGWLRGLFGV